MAKANLKFFASLFSKKVTGVWGRAPRFYLLTLLLTACVDFAADPLSPALPVPVVEVEEEPLIEPAPVRAEFGGVLRLAMRAPVTLNPLLNEDVTVARVLQLVYEPLIIFDEELRPVPHLASLEFNFHGTSVVVSLRPDARWSDGVPVSADDLIFSIETLQNAPEGAIYRSNVESFALVEALDERSVRITFDTVTGGAAYLFNFPIIPQHHFSLDPMSYEAPGNGPYTFESFTPSESLSLMHNMYSFRRPSNIVRVKALITVDAETDRHAFDRGLTDIYLAEVPEWARHHSVKPVSFFEHPAMHFDFIGFNFSRSIPQMPQFRQAIAHSLDVEQLIGDVFLTHAIPTRTPIHPASWLHEPEAPQFDHEPSTAIALAEQVRRVALRDGLWPHDDEENQLALTVLVNRENIEGLQIAETITTQMNAMGLPTELMALSFSNYIWHLENGYFDLFIGGYRLSLRPDLHFAFHSESQENLLHLSDPELDRLLEAAAVASTDSQFYRTLSDLQIHIAQELPIIPLAFRHSAVITDRRIQGNIQPTTSNIFTNIQDWSFGQ